MGIDLAALEVGAELPAQRYGPITRTLLALYAGGSGDHNPIHIDSDFVHAAGQPDVFAHGMLSMAYLARYLLGFTRQDKLRSWSVRFVAVTPVNAHVTCSARVASLDRDHQKVTLALRAGIDDGMETVVGRAVISL